jgi:hypothetical protein
MTPLEFCKKYFDKDIDYIINPDDTIDVNGDAFLFDVLGDMEKLPVKFGKVYGEFNCSMNNLTTLEGSPNYVGSDFLCYWNNLTTLEHSPKYVGGDIDCHHNNLISLEGYSKYIGGTFYSDIITHHILGSIQGNIYCNKQRIII